MADLTAITKAARIDIEIQQGSTFEYVIDFGTIPISALGWRGQIRRTHQDAEVLAEFAFEVLVLSGLDVEVETNVLRILLTPALTTPLPYGNLVHDIEAFTENDAWVMRVFEGRARVTPEVTRG